MIERNRVYLGDCLDGMAQMDDSSVDCCITSPPYWGLRDYGVDGQLGLEPTIEEYIEKMVVIFREIRRVLKDDGTLWLNMGDCYHSGDSGGYHKARAGVSENLGHANKETDFIGAPNRRTQPGLKDKDLVGMPWRIALALQADSWYLRSDIIWHKPNPMPESVTDRPTKAHEYIFLMSKSAKYWYDAEAIKEPSTYPNGPNSPQSIASPYGQGFTRKAQKVPSGWDQGEGAHGTIHRDGRTQKIHGNLPGRDDGGNACNKPGQDTRNKRSVWTVATQPFSEAHFAVYPEKLIKPCVLAGCRPGGVVLDPFMGAGTTAVVAAEYGRDYIGFELNPEYIKIAEKRIYDRTRQENLQFTEGN